MKKRTLLIFLLAAVSTLSVASAGVISGCATPNDETKQETPVTYTVTFNSNGGSAVEAKTVEEGDTVAKPADPTNTDATKTFGGWYTDAACTQAFDFSTPITGNITLYAKWNTSAQTVDEFTVTFETNGGSAIQPATVEEGGKVTRPADPTNDDATKTFGGWYTDAECTQEYDFDTVVTSNFTLYAKWNDVVVEYEFVTSTPDAAAIAAAPVGSDGKFAADTTVGKFTFGQGTKPEDSGATINTQGKDITIVLGGRTNSLSFTAEGGSSSGNTDIELYSVDAQGVETLVKALGSVANKVPGNFAYGTGADEAMPAGTYIIRTSRSARITNLQVVEELAKSDMTGITVSGATTKFLANRTFDSTGLNVTLNYENGRKDPITSGFSVDSNAVDMSTAGTYTVTVSYTPDGATEPFTASYDVVVYAVDHLELSDFSLGTGRVTLPVQKLFALNGQFSSANLAVQAICTAPDVTEEEVFILNSTEFSVSSADTSTAGEKTVTVTAFNKMATYAVNVVDLSAASKTTVKVDAAGTVGITDGVLTVTSLNDAIQAFKLMGTADGLIKTINVAAGTYNEKVEIDIPNVKLVGAGADTTTIVFDALAGLLDPSGSMVYSTDGSATVSIRESAEGFYAEGITFKNYYNTNELYQQSKLEMEDTQAVACLVQADKSYFKNCNFTSYHDTLYAMTGRQVYENCYIEGRTDYIFGYNATCYFTGCTLKTLGANDEKNGGYIVATKGANKGGDDVKYGYIFDNCTLTADENVVAGTVSLARGWDVYMTVAFIECDISGAYSLEAYGDTASVKNDRYTKMNKDPDATKLFEYGNTGAGALSAETIATADPTTGVIANLCTVMTQAQATEYTTLTTIFAATNGNMVYADAWDGTPVSTVAITVVYGTEQQVIYGYAGGYIDAADLSKAQSALMPEGKMLDKYSLTDGGEAVDPATIKLTEDFSLYMTVKDIPADALQVVATVNADDYEVGYSIKSKPISNDYITITGSGSGDTKVAASTAGAFVANDDSGLSFTNGFQPGGNGRTVIIDAKQDCTITYYYTLSDSTWGPKSGTISWTIGGVAAGASTETVSANVAHCVTIELKAGDQCVITPSGNRIVTFAVVVEAIVA